VKRMFRILSINQTTNQQIIFRNNRGAMTRVNRGACYPNQLALVTNGDPDHRLNPITPCHGRDIPDFFLSQSNSIFKRPISPYNRSGSWCSDTGFGPRFPSNNFSDCWLSSTAKSAPDALHTPVPTR
ncbi:hypothetical protein, partial [Ferrovum sp.]|uniref:hypothetical protein n=1 Tax=Ferrovum sp. TaxID=2609467 RepID=UPI00260D6B4B